jgi:L-fuconolactonase
MGIVDSHHHLWDTNVLRYPLFDSLPKLRRPFTIDDYEKIAAANHVSQSVCVEAASAGAPGWEETEWLLQETRRSKIVTRIVAWAPVDSPGLRTYLQRLRSVEAEKVSGVRRAFEFEASDYPEREEVIAGVKILPEFDLLFELVLFERSLGSAIRLVQACPETQFVLDHAGKPRIRERIDQPWKEHIATLSGMPNVVCKISGLSTEADRERWTNEDLEPYICHAIDCFGWDRVLFGSDWPVCELAGGFERWLDAAFWATRDASDAERSKLFVGNARNLYRLSEEAHAG